MYAIIETGGKQYKVENGDVIFIEKLDVEADAEVTFDKVIAGVDLLTGFGGEVSDGAKLLGIVDDVSTGKNVAKTGGKGSNHLKPAEDALGDHSSFRKDKEGNISNYTTYKNNPQNPTGFDEVKRVDMKGQSHKDKQGKDIPTPHVHEKVNNVKTVRIATEDELPKRK